MSRSPRRSLPAGAGSQASSVQPPGLRAPPAHRRHDPPCPKLPSPRLCGQAVQAAFWADASAHALRPHLGLGNGAAGSILEAMLATLGTS